MKKEPQQPCDEAGLYKDPNNRRFKVLPAYSWQESSPPGVPSKALQELKIPTGPAICFVQLQPQFDVGLAKGHRPINLVPREVFRALVQKKIYVPEDRIPNRKISARRRKMLLAELTHTMEGVNAQGAGEAAPAVAPAAATSAPLTVNTGHKGRKAKALTAG